ACWRRPACGSRGSYARSTSRTASTGAAGCTGSSAATGDPLAHEETARRAFGPLGPTYAAGARRAARRRVPAAPRPSAALTRGWFLPEVPALVPLRSSGSRTAGRRQIFRSGHAETPHAPPVARDPDVATAGEHHDRTPVDGDGLGDGRLLGVDPRQRAF